MNEKNYEAIIEAILFTMGESVELDKIAAAIELDKKETKAIIEKMMKHYENPSIGVKIIELDDAYQMCTKSEMYEYLIKIARRMFFWRRCPSSPISSRSPRWRSRRSAVFPAITR